MNYIGQVNSNKQKYLYFRTEATDANDDATGDSALFPVSSLMGMQPTSGISACGTISVAVAYAN